LEIVKANEGTEFLAYFPQFTDLFHVTTGAYERLITSLDQSYQKTMQVLNSKFTEVTEQEFKAEFRTNIEVHKDLRVLYCAIGQHVFTNQTTVAQTIHKMAVDKVGCKQSIDSILMTIQVCPLVKFHLSNKMNLQWGIYTCLLVFGEFSFIVKSLNAVK